MYIAKGTTRIAVCLPKARLVVKFAKTKPLGFLGEVWYHIRHIKKCEDNKMRWERTKHLFSLEHEHCPLRYTILNGIWQNWLERRMWKQTRSGFLEPTYFSLLGLVNIQRYGIELVEIHSAALWHQMVTLTNEEAWSNGHHFANAENFSLEDGHIRMTDYGGDGIWEIVEKYGDKIVAEYDPEPLPLWAEETQTQERET